MALNYEFQKLRFSGTHTYMNSPTNRIALQKTVGFDELPMLELVFPECGGTSGAYFRRVVRISIPMTAVSIFWNGTSNRYFDVVVKSDPAYAKVRL